MEPSGKTEPGISSLPASYSEAIDAKSAHYFTGKPCKNGHVSPRLTSSRQCMECHKECMRNAREKDPEKSRLAARKWVNENRERINKTKRERYAENPIPKREAARKRRASNPDVFREYERKNRANNRLHRAISEGVRRSLVFGGKNGRRTFDILGYTLDELKGHLENLFLKGMTWDNYGAGGWHIDHKTPRSVHNFSTTDDIDFRKCWALDNLQPLWDLDNKKKSARLDKPFQPSLALAITANDNTKQEQAA